VLVALLAPPSAYANRTDDMCLPGVGICHVTGVAASRFAGDARSEPAGRGWGREHPSGPAIPSGRKSVDPPVVRAVLGGREAAERPGEREQ